jgi:hypothetical protein
MRKLKLEAEELVVESFDPVVFRDVQKGTVRGNASDVYSPCTEYPCEQETNDPRLRLCHTPYLECATVGWTCDYRCGTSDPITTEC